MGEAEADWTGDAQYFEYSRAANPIGAGITSKVPIRTFSAALHSGADTTVEVLDLSTELNTPWPATSPALQAAFVLIQAGQSSSTDALATSQLFYVLSGSGKSEIEGQELRWAEGDVFVLPMSASVVHSAEQRAVLYWVTDEPLMHYLGVAPTSSRFSLTRFPAERIRHELDLIASDPRAMDRNRLSVLLGTSPQTQTLTITHVLWAMFGLLPIGDCFGSLKNLLSGNDVVDEWDFTHCAPARAVSRIGFVAYTTSDLPNIGLRAFSVRRVRGGAEMMSHSRNFVYALTATLVSLRGPTAQRSHQYGA